MNAFPVRFKKGKWLASFTGRPFIHLDSALNVSSRDHARSPLTAIPALFTKVMSL